MKQQDVTNRPENRRRQPQDALPPSCLRSEAFAEDLLDMPGTPGRLGRPGTIAASPARARLPPPCSRSAIFTLPGLVLPIALR